MWPFGIIKRKVILQAFVQLDTIIEHMDIDAFVFDALPKPFDKDVVDCSAFAVHADSNGVIPFCEQGCIFKTGELAALVRVNDLRLAIHLNGLFDDLTTPQGGHRVADAPVDHITGVDVYNGAQVHKPSPHRNVCDINGPDLIGSVNDKIPQQVRVNGVLFIFFARIALSVNGLPANQFHESFDPLAIDLMAKLAQPSG